MKCYACGGQEFEEQTVELTTKVGVHRIIDTSVQRPVCLSCGEYTIPAGILEKVELRAALVALTDAPNFTGEMLRYTRKALGFTQTELAEQIASTKESVSRWEREERPMEPWVPMVVLALIRGRLLPPPKGVELKKAG